MLRNSEHYADPTPGAALKALQDKGRKKAIKALVMAQEELRARGYEVRGDLRITERKTGRMYIIRNWNEPEETTQ